MRTAVCVTPPGRSAIASIEVRGFESLDEFEPFFHPASNRSISAQPDGRVIFGTWLNLSGTAEELVVSRISAHEIHIHCHGGPVAVSAIMDSLASIDFQTQQIARADWSNVETNFGSEVSCALLNASTRKIAFRLLRLQQFFAEAFSRLRAELENDLSAAVASLRTLEQSYATGQFLTRPVRVVLAGLPNVGKSSINNQILGYDRSIIFDQPGTTRDVVSATTTIDGWEFEFSDTAGIRSSDDKIEVAGVELARQTIDQADQVVWVSSAEDSTAPAEIDPQELISAIGSRSLISVFNKTDLISEQQIDLLRKQNPSAVFTDATSGEGIGQLMDLIKHQVVDPEPGEDELVLFTPRQRRLVEQAISALESGDVATAKQLIKKLESDP